MDRLQAMQIFTRVVEMHGFSKAAENLSIPASTVTRAIKELEAFLGVRLLQRTTRHLNLTPDGSLYYEHCRRLLAELEAVETSFPGQAGQAQGKLRVGMTASFARLFVVPAIKAFQVRYPNVELTLTLSDRTVELVPEGIDCVIRAGVPHDSPTLVARRIASFEWVTCASPAYLEEYGEPHSLDELKHHHAVGFLSGDQGRPMHWRFVVNDEERVVRMPQKLVVNDTETYIACGLEGLGLIRAASYMVLPHLRSGKLQQVLSSTPAPAVPISVMYPQNRHLSPTVRAFVDWVSNLAQSAERGGGSSHNKHGQPHVYVS
ncbi:transcriptional regulator, LysR family [Franzmannia pantelleriensis]|uniref:Transcriptional regulator, LysR family n=1 Tax=Franzmannia pantelleriensis TaxID=48727 RepID=A0A1G9P9B6_9GAMM|nr:LysR family transcriptional regulator [Halomonas pantelleriensis]SDL95386.1 transcriptional regulator, LysR family [Halomonas pantelleriensis]